MVGKEDWLFRPVLAGHIRAESLWDGTIDLAIIAILNEAMDVEAENQHRVRKALENG